MMGIRPARLPDDKPAITAFIEGIQAFERPIEPDRRTDPAVAEDCFPEVERRLENGAAFIAEEDGVPRGWALVCRGTNAVYVHAQERDFAKICELFVVEPARGRGLGRTLVAACEGWAADQGLKVVMIGVLAGDAPAQLLYRDIGFRPYRIHLRKYLS